MELYHFKPINTYKHYIIRVLFNLSHITYASFILSYYLYYLALEKCFLGQLECSRKVSWIYKKIIQTFFSSIIIAILFELMLLKLISKKHLIHVFFFKQASIFIAMAKNFMIMDYLIF